MLSLVSDSASLSSLSEDPFAPLQIFAIHDLLHGWGQLLVLSAPPPNPMAGAMPPLLRPLRPPLHRLLQRSWKTLPQPQEPWGTETQEAAMPLAWGLPGMGLTTWGTGSDCGWLHTANPIFPVTAQVYFCALCSTSHKDPKYIPPNLQRFLSTVVKKQCPGQHPWENMLRCLCE